MRITKGNHRGSNTTRQGETNVHKRREKRGKNTRMLKGHKRAWKSKYKTPKDTEP